MADMETRGMIERVARVLYEKNHPRGSSWSPWEALNSSEIGCYVDLARAAIEAMREPTEEMLDASWRLTGESREMRARVHASVRRHQDAMIEAALSIPPDDTGNG